MTQAQKKKKGGLGRGLDALFQDGEASHYDDFAAQISAADSVIGTESTVSTTKIQELAVGDLVPGKYQPRTFFSDEKLQQLVESVKAHGVLQPLLVRPLDDGSYEIVAGERRWRAAQQAQLHKLPVVIREMDDRDALEIALIENLQRQDLNPLEEAEGYKRLMDEFAYKQDDLAGQLGKSRSHIANMMRLLKLPETVANYVRKGDLSAGHARALLTADDIEGLAKTVIKQGLSVRETERRAQNKDVQKPKKATISKPRKKKSVDVIELENKMTSLLGLPFTIDVDEEDTAAGRVTINYETLDQLDELLEKLSV